LYLQQDVYSGHALDDERREFHKLILEKSEKEIKMK